MLPAGGGPPDAALVAASLGAAVAGVFEEGTAADSFRRLFRANDVVGIKINALAGSPMSARPVVVRSVTRWLEEAGVPARNIVIFERDQDELARAWGRGGWLRGFDVA